MGFFSRAAYNPLSRQPPPDAEIAAWVARLVALRDQGAAIRLVQVYGIARWTSESWVSALPADRLEAIAQAARDAGLPAQAFV